MSLKEDILLGAGINPSQPTADAAAIFFRAFPLKKADPESSEERSPLEIVESGYLEGPSECRGMLDVLAPGGGEQWNAFGISWPVGRIEGMCVAPALPIRLGNATEEGPDGVYRMGDGGVFREAVGEEELFLSVAGESRSGTFPFDLLCFGPVERYLLTGGMIEIEDLFSRMRFRIDRNIAERIFLRTLRLAPAVLDGLSFPEPDGEPPIILEISRPSELFMGRELGLEALFSARADTESVVRTADGLIVRRHDGETAVFTVTEDNGTSRAELDEGMYTLTSCALAVSDASVRVSVEISPDIDPLRPGMRGRLVFDLHSDLVSLTRD